MINSALFRCFAMFILSIMVFSLGACTIAKISGRGPVPYMLNNPSTKVEVISHFKEKKMITFDWTSSFDVSEILSEKLTASNADAIINLTITIKSDFGTFCLNVITIGLARATIFQVEGDLVKAPQGIGSILENSEILAESDNIEDIAAHMKKLQKDKDVVTLPTLVRTENGFALIRQNIN